MNTSEPGGIEAILASAVSEVLVMSTGSAPIGQYRAVDRENLARGVRYRVLFPDSMRLTTKLSRMALAGAAVRTNVEIPVEAIVIDGTTALLPNHPTGVAAFRLPGVVTATLELFGWIWSSAVPLTPVEEAGDDGPLTWRERDLMTLLYTGHTDESAAMKLGISVRTVRRMVADIMNRLGARSRFQAGAKAAGQGWLMARAS
ncbi:DNA-binding CsgD family transcriptional regulator [Hamadaea flava]|uniref:Helix-turn-helix transcriptional regulator n=1 Tax=Hamadaea flava TaxID=1742688 RepID=A0ABV8LMK1_9ACTN|nr:helix-turn-helix transcriptional regulator [Hamadaea flava]MCP2323144.1 DNA-binding CsgD family transcriptional regulator [Hamadaea flava]